MKKNVGIILTLVGIFLPIILWLFTKRPYYWSDYWSLDRDIDLPGLPVYIEYKYPLVLCLIILAIGIGLIFTNWNGHLKEK